MDQAVGTDTMRADDPLAKAALDYHEYPQPGNTNRP
jgi:hypothetical protein